MGPLEMPQVLQVVQDFRELDFPCPCPLLRNIKISSDTLTGFIIHLAKVMPKNHNAKAMPFFKQTTSKNFKFFSSTVFMRMFITTSIRNRF